MELNSVNSIAVVSFIEGEEYPRLTRAIMDKLCGVMGTIQESRVFHGVVIAANSKSFATGAELEEIVQLEGIAARDFAFAGQRLFREIAHFPLPVVAAVRGFCLGGAFDLAMACHQRVATYDASFGHPGATLGLMTGWGGTQCLPRLLGRSAAIQILLTGVRIPAAQALTLGLVKELVSSSDLIDCAVRHAEKMHLEAGALKARVRQTSD